MLFQALLLCLVSIAQYAAANVEKAIFLGPEVVNIPLGSPTLDDLHLDVLTPDNGTLRTRILASAPLGAATEEEAGPRGKSTWLLLDNLNPGQRYEARISWAATVSEPTPSHNPRRAARLTNS